MRTFLVIFVLLPIASVGFFEARKAYWDSQVEGMCEKDGGDKVHETVVVTRAQFLAWGGVGDVLGLPNESDNRQDIPFFRRAKDQTVRAEAPQVVRLQTEFVRRSDGRVLGQSVYYYRRGGDFPSWAHESSFGCARSQAPIERSIFHVQ
jgi:hypothetical protein